MSCGCLARELASERQKGKPSKNPKEIIDLKGKRFGKLIVLEMQEHIVGEDVMWKCKCDCGNEIMANVGNLKNGHTKSCGCLRVDRCKTNFTKHGLEHTRLYGIWSDMRLRCYDEKNIAYHRYGGRGITICDEWKNDVKAFYDWAMANGYKDSLTIDRIDNDGNYCPENCRWVTRKEQNNNRRDNHKLTFNGKTQSIPEWAEELGLTYGGLYDRLYRGWPIEKVLAPRMRG